MLDIISLFLKHLIWSEFLAGLSWKRLLLLTKDRLQESSVYLLELNIFTAVENQDYSTLPLPLGKDSAFLFAVPTPPSQEIIPYIYTLCCFCRFPFLYRSFSLKCDPTWDVSSFFIISKPPWHHFILDTIIKKKCNQSWSVASLFKTNSMQF